MTSYSLGALPDITAAGHPHAVMNLLPTRDYELCPFINQMLASRDATKDDLSEFASVDTYLDATTRDLTSLPGGETDYTIIFLSNGSSTGAIRGTEGADFFKLTWEGDVSETATILVRGGTAISELVYDYPNKSATFKWDGTDASLGYLEIQGPAVGDFPVNFVLVRNSEQSLYDSGEIFRAQWVTEHQGYKALRCMNWNETNFSVEVDWADRTPGTSTHYGNGQVIPYEVQMAACNKLNADYWVCTPATATADYITQLATLINANLNSNQKVWAERSNEIWNHQFLGYNQTSTIVSKTVENGGWNIGSPTQTDVYSMHGKLTYDMVTSFQAVLGTDRVRGVLAVQTASGGDHLDVVLAPTWETQDPGNFVAPHTVCDFLAVTHYFGDGVIPNNIVSIETWLDTDEATMVAGMIPLLQTALTTTNGYYTAKKADADTYGLMLIGYEGNQHMTASQASTYIDLAFDAEVGAFTSGQTVTGGTSGATATIVGVEASNLQCILVSGTFQDNENLTDPITGDATSNIPSGVTYPLYPSGAARSDYWSALQTLTYSSDMADMHQTNYDNWVLAGGTYWCWFLDYFSATYDGIWPARRYLGDTNNIATKVEAIVALPRWFIDV